MKEANKTFFEVDFAQQDLSYSHFDNCKFYCCKFDHTILQDTKFQSCTFFKQDGVEGCSFQYSNLQDASFNNCQLSLSNFTGANCFGAEFRDCDLKGANFVRAQFGNRVSDKVHFCSVFITGCNLSYTNFERQCIEKCDLFENKWTGANLNGASLKGSDLSRGVFSADSWGSFSMTGCDLSHSELDGLDPRRVNLNGVKICAWQQEQLLEQLGLIILP